MSRHRLTNCSHNLLDSIRILKQGRATIVSIHRRRWTPKIEIDNWRA
jgi:hypothetical protein